MLQPMEKPFAKALMTKALMTKALARGRRIDA
jgi:hypothetical protein